MTWQISIIVFTFNDSTFIAFKDFWGVHPEDSAKLKASMKENNLQVSTKVYDLIKYRLDEMLPKNNAEFLDFFSIVWPGWDTSESQWWHCKSYLYSECGLYFGLKDDWDVSMSNKAKKIGDDILSLYYDNVSSPTPPTPPTPTLPTPTPPSGTCQDSIFRFKLIKNNKTITRGCDWVANKSTRDRCQISGVKEHCPSTCSSCSNCIDSINRFKFQFNGKVIIRSCTWVSNKNTSGRCTNIVGMADTCRDTCNNC